MNYLFECECGHKTRISPAQAGTSAGCICGRTNTIPSLSRLKKEVPVQPERVTPIGHNIATPAVVLVILSAISIVGLLLAISFDVFLLSSGIASKLPAPSFSMNKGEQIAIRMIWGMAMLFANVLIFFGTIEMKRLRHFGMAKTAAFLAMIPGLSPFFILGIPFGIMALTALTRPEAYRTFKQ